MPPFPPGPLWPVQRQTLPIRLPGEMEVWQPSRSSAFSGSGNDCYSGRTLASACFNTDLFERCYKGWISPSCIE